MGTRKITTNQLKKIINEVLNEGFYYPIDSETQKKFNEVCKNIMYPHGSKEQLTEDQFIETLVNLGKSCYKDINTQNDMMIKLMGGDLYENKKISESKKIYYHIIEYGDYGNIGHQGYYDTEQEARERIAELENMFPDVSFQIFPTDSRREPPITTV